jgi:hypothetical protein
MGHTKKIFKKINPMKIKVAKWGTKNTPAPYTPYTMLLAITETQ